MKLEKIIYYLTLLFLFLIPWQTRWRYFHGSLNGGYWEYGTFSLYATELLLWLIALLYAYFLFFKKRYIHKVFNEKILKQNSKYVLVLLLFVILNLVNIYISLDSDISYQHFIRLLSALCIGVIIINTFVSKKDRIIAITVFWSAGIIQGLMAIWQFLAQKVYASSLLGMSSQNPADFGVGVIEYINERWMRAYGSLTGPNPLGSYLAVLFFVGIFLLIFAEKQKYKRLLLIGQLIILLGVILSFSRAAWLAIIIGSVVLIGILLLKRKENKKIFEIIWRQYTCYIILSLLCIIALAPIFVARFTFSNHLEYVSITERKQQIQQSSTMIDRNLTFGTGAGTYTLATYYNEPLFSSWVYQPVHNAALLMIAEVGLFISFILFLWYAWILKIVWKNNRFFLPVLISLIVVSLFEHWTWSLYSGLIFWFSVWFLSLRIEKKSQD